MCRQAADVGHVGSANVCEKLLTRICGSEKEPELAAGIQLVGLVDLDAKVARARADKHGLTVPTGTDLPTMLADLRPDMVFDIVVPAARHQVVLQALAAGAHVLSEKPMANSLAETRALVTAAEQAGRIHAVIQNRRHLPGIRRVKALLASGSLGDLTAVHLDFFTARISAASATRCSMCCFWTWPSTPSTPPAI